MRGMDTLGNFEIYVPREAEVKTVPIESLRLSVQQRIGVKRSRCGHKSSSTSVIWISPVVIRERVRSPNKLDTSDMAKYNMASAVIQDRKTISSPCYMAFVTSNCVALRVLGEFLEVNGNGKGRIPAQTSPLPHGTATRCPKDAIIIHHRRIFLSLRPIRGSRWHLETTPAQTLKSQKMSVFESPAVSEKQTCHPVAPDAACDDARRERAFLRRFGVTRFIQVTLSRLPSQYLTYLPSTPQQSKRENLHTSDNANEQGASHGYESSTKTHNTDLKQEVVIQSEVKNDYTKQGYEQHPSKIFIPNPNKEEAVFRGRIRTYVHNTTGVTYYPPKNHEEDGTDDVWDVKGVEDHGTDNVWDVKGEGEIEDRCGTEPHVTDFNTVVIEDSPIDTAEALSDSPNVHRESPRYDSGLHLETDDSEDGTVEGGGEIWGADLPLVPAFSTPETHYGFDFDQLAREETIDRIRAKLRESEAALCSLRSLR